MAASDFCNKKDSNYKPSHIPLSGLIMANSQIRTKETSCLQPYCPDFISKWVFVAEIHISAHDVGAARLLIVATPTGSALNVRQKRAYSFCCRVWLIKNVSSQGHIVRAWIWHAGTPWKMHKVLFLSFCHVRTRLKITSVGKSKNTQPILHPFLVQSVG